MAKKNFYAVVAGRKPGIYVEWFGANGAEAQIKAFNDAVYKGFATQDEAEAWFMERAGTKPAVFSAAPTGQGTRAEPAGPYAQMHREALAASKVVIYTDGGSKPNPGPGGYGVVLLHNERRKELSGGFATTTNNRMELMGCIAGLDILKQRATVVLFSDSSYVVNGFEKRWVHGWRDKNWKRREGGEDISVPNSDLWQQLLALYERHDVSFVLVRGHVGIAENERCDVLATQARKRRDLPRDPGFAG